MVDQDDKPGDTSARPTAEFANQQAQMLLAAERPIEAIATIENAFAGSAGVPDAIAFQLLMQKGEAHRQIGNVESAIDAIAAGVALQPDNEPALQKLGYLTATAGYHVQARPYRERLFQLQARRLPDRLAEGLQALWERARDSPTKFARLGMGLGAG